MSTTNGSPYGQYGPQPDYGYGPQRPTSPAPGPKRPESERFFRWIRSSRLIRSDDRWIGGVCGGLARHFGVSPTLVRALVLGSVLLFGFGAAFYAFAWFLLPDERDGSILCEQLDSGRSVWNCVGCLVLLVMAIVVPIPGAGFVGAAVAAGVLWLIVQQCVRADRREGVPGGGYGTTWEDPRYRPQASPYFAPPTRPNPNPQSYPQNGDSRYGGAAPRPRDASRQPSPDAFGQSRTMPQDGSYAAQTGKPQSSSFSWSQSHPAPAQESPVPPQTETGSMRPAASPTGFPPPSPAASGATMTSAYRAPAPKARPKYARRKPAGPVVVVTTLGVIFILAAAMLLTLRDLSIEPIIQAISIWSAVVCLLLGGVTLVLGLAGRRSGGLIPIGVIAAIVAVCMVGVDLGYGYVCAGYGRFYDTYGHIDVSGYRRYTSSDSILGLLSDGVAFDGTDYDNDRVSIDLTGLADGEAHSVTLNNGNTVQSKCPTGTVTLAVSKAQVGIILPQDCSFGFGANNANFEYGYYSYGSPLSAVQGVWGFGVGFGDDTMRGWYSQPDDYDEADYSDGVDGGQDPDSGPSWVYDSDYLPQDGPELIINVKYAVQGRVTVLYPDSPNSLFR